MDKLIECKELLQQTQQKVTSSAQEWRTFLQFASRIYKYDFTSALLIYAKRPDATALATEEIWRRVGRFVTSYAAKIPVLRDTDSQIRLEYVFDVSDTGGNRESQPVPWKLKPEYESTVLLDLADRYGMEPGNRSLSEYMIAVVDHVMESEYTDSILEGIMEFPLPELQRGNSEEQFFKAVADSVRYMVFSRALPDQAGDLWLPNLYALEWLKQPEHLHILGDATISQSCTLLRQVESSVKQLEFELKRSIDHGISRRERITLSGTGRSSSGGRSTPDEVREEVQSVSAGGAPGPLRSAAGRTGADGSLPSGGAGSGRVRGEHPETTAPGASGPENRRPDGTYPVQQLAVSDGGGNDAGERSVSAQIKDYNPGFRPLSTINQNPAYTAFLSDYDFLHSYLFPALTSREILVQRKDIYNFYANDTPSPKAAAQFLRKSFDSQRSILIHSSDGTACVWIGSNGISTDVSLPEGDYSRKMSWSVCEKYIRQLIDDGTYLEGKPARVPQQISLFDSPTPDANPKNEGKKVLIPAGDPAAPEWIQNAGGTKITMEGDVVTIESLAGPKNDHYVEMDIELPDENPAASPAQEPPQTAFHEIVLQLSAVSEVPEIREASGKQEPEKRGTGSAFSEGPAERINFRYDDLSEFSGGQRTHYKTNVEAIRLLKRIESEERHATAEEQQVLAKYVGWGGIPQAFDKRNDKWEEEFHELQDLLAPEEYAAARASTLTAFYTPPAVIQAVQTALENFGFTGGNILEPSCGTGRFFGLLPDDAARNSNLYGVELDSITGRIAQQLYQSAHIQIRGFEKSAFPDNFFDIAIGNVPFGEFKVPDARYDKYNFLIHDYFFAKTLDKVRPGGIIAFVTSKGTMDKENSEVRRYIARRAELIGAIRFPNTMMYTEGNTKVTADLIFLQKRDRMVDIEPDWVHLTYLDNGVPVNTYFADHPEMMLGDMVFDDSMYGNAKDTALVQRPGLDWKAELVPLIESIRGQITAPSVTEQEQGNPVQSIPADPNVKNYTYTVVDDKLYYRENAVMLLQENLPAAREQRIRGMIEIRDALREVIRVQSEDYPESAISETRAELNRLYDHYTYDYGYLTGTGNRLAFREDSDYPLLCSLESIDDEGHVSKAAIFDKRTIRPQVVITHCDSAEEALPVCMDRKGCVDLSYIAELTGKSEDEIITGLKGLIYRNPETKEYESVDEYLSGNVREKLDTATVAARQDGQYAENVDALKLVQPKELDASQIDVRLGSPLLDTEDIRQFIVDTLKPSSDNADRLSINYVPSQALWKINGLYHYAQQNDVLAGRKYGTHRIDAYELIELTLNQKIPTIRDKQPDDTYVLNPKETAAAREKQRIIERKFEEWVFADPQRRERLVRKYNLTYNNTRLRRFDGSYLTFPGMTPEIKLNPHQVNAVARIMQSGNTLLAHCVGAGKTFTMIAAAMESKRLGLCQKNMFVVPGHLIDQWGADILRLYPGANVLLATKNDFEKSKRQRLVSRIATGDYDVIVIAASSFEKIPISMERRERLMQQQIDSLMEAMELAADESGDDWTVKNMERTKKALEAQLEKLMNQERKDDLLTFEQLGVDQLFVDEAHFYKNLFIATKMTNVAGVSQEHALKASDMLMKSQYINELHGGQRGVVFATGTPVSNSMAELFTMQTYLQPEELAVRGIAHFDAWAAEFGRVISSLELAPDGTQYRYKSRFAQFVNLPELMTLYSKMADIQSADMLKLPVPALKGGKPITIVAQPSPEQQEYVQELVKRFEIIHNGSIDPHDDNALKATNDGRNAALDMRLVYPDVPDFENSKVNLAVRNIYDIWQRSENVLGTQMVFCDLSTPKGNGAFSVYDDMKTKLILMGIPEEQIKFIHDANTEAQKEKLFADFRAGKTRILFGSTVRMGAGTNAQKRMIALHHMDAPWRPADLEQREGRILRQGNDNPEVEIYRYVTEGSFDAFSWQILEQKQRFISQVSRGEIVERHAEDIDETTLDYATVKMLSSKDPRVKEREELRVRVAELNQLKAQYNSEKYSLEDTVLKQIPEKLARNSQAIDNLRRDIALRDSHPSEEFSIVLLGQNYTKREDAGAVILDMAMKHHKIGVYLPIGEYRGFRVELFYNSFANTHSLFLCGSAKHSTEIGQSAVGCTVKLDNLLKEFENRISDCEQSIDQVTRQLEEAKAQLALPWEHEAEYEEKSERLSRLDIALAEEMHPEKTNSEEIDYENNTSLKSRLMVAAANIGQCPEPLCVGGISHIQRER